MTSSSVTALRSGDAGRTPTTETRDRSLAAQLGSKGDRDWQERAACAESDPDLFFPNGEARKQIAEAKQVCFACGVRRECLRLALLRGYDWGVWGGLSAVERRRAVFWGRLPSITGG